MRTNEDQLKRDWAIDSYFEKMTEIARRCELDPVAIATARLKIETLKREFDALYGEF